mgnify:CR=1 FL=1
MSTPRITSTNVVEERAPHSGAPRAAPLWRKLRFSTDIRV